ncbi:MAG: dihydropteroate synthase [Cyclobacteriaceae bacterium]|nr:dihydropteroate synthase [Cyclobacteriaceae bacterium]
MNCTLNAGGRLLVLNPPVVMGILNITPDSFYASSRVQDEKALLQHAEKMLEDGAAILDVGGYSSRPGAEDISLHEELQRVVPAVQLLHRHFPDAIISVDTFRTEVAREALNEGAVIINDITGGLGDHAMAALAAERHVPYICMHMRGTPQTMMQHTDYSDLMGELLDFFHKRIAALHAAGVKDIILDPGFGFAKTPEQNFELLSRLELLHLTGKPLLVGLSRKSMIWKTLGITVDEALNGTTALHMTALLKGACILRVHDVKEAVQTIKLFNRLTEAEAAIPHRI